jgi:hypothetical protein
MRQFLVGHIGVIYNRYKVTIVCSVPVQSASGETKLPFRVEGEIDPKKVRSRPRAMRPEIGDGKQCRSMHQAKVTDMPAPAVCGRPSQITLTPR